MAGACRSRTPASRRTGVLTPSPPGRYREPCTKSELRAEPSGARLHQQRAHAGLAQRGGIRAAVRAPAVRDDHVGEVHLSLHLLQLAAEAAVLVQHGDADAEARAPGEELVRLERRHLPAHLDSRTTLRRSALGTMTELFASSAM